MDGFREIVKNISGDSLCLDVGAWGLGGVNTSRCLDDMFDNVIHMNIEKKEGVNLIGDFYKYKFDCKFDVIVLDLCLKQNTEIDWTQAGFNRVYDLLEKDGIVILYICGEFQYKPSLIKYDKFNLFAIYPDDRRKDIIWVALQKRCGL